ncbi:hypothetical protein C0585_05960 [Candidatus Woesearchaeota archaeon]|nr:MAG: hypothetical protein C0585_05960 [Candidatus Woesearchaeota archaeon]
MNKQNNKIKTRNVNALIIALIIVYFTILANGEPAGPTISYVSNSTSANAGNGTLQSGDEGGYITTITLDVLQQNFGWKAYVGNVTGKLTLDDADNYTIYDWSIANLNAEVYISRNQTIDWTNIGCAARSIIEAQDTDLGKDPSADDDSINLTFDGAVHDDLIIGGNPALTTCPTISTFVNDTAQSALFQEMLLNDSQQRLVYATIAEDDADGYRNGTTFDFQAIVPDTLSTATTTNYYFFVEIGN